jgi:small subunit ribosomal protein S8
LNEANGKRTNHGKQIEDRGCKAEAEVLHEDRASLHAVRTASRGVSQVRDLSHLFPEAGGSGLYSRGSKGQLVARGRRTAAEATRHESHPREGFADMMTDPIADMLTRIRNAVRIERPTVEMPLSKVKRGVAEVLKREGFIWDWREVEGHPVPQLQLELKYGPNGERLIRHIKRVSSPGRRVYSRSARLKPVLGGLGISILSTSSGVVSDREARQRKLGGEVLCELW